MQNLDIQKFNSNPNNFIFDGLMIEASTFTNNPTKIRTKLFPETNINIMMESDRIQKTTDEIKEIGRQFNEFLNGPSKVDFGDGRGIHIGHFKGGQKNGKGIFINENGDKLVGIWEGKDIIGKLYWNILKTDLENTPNVKIRGKKSNLKQSSFNNYNSQQNLNTDEVNFNHSKKTKKQADFMTYNHYHPHKEISGRKFKNVAVKISRVSATGKFTFDFYGQIVQTGYGQLNLSDGSYYRGQLSSNLFHGYGELRFRDGSYYKGQFCDGFYEGCGELYNSYSKTYIRGMFKEGKPDGVCIFSIDNEEEDEYSTPINSNSQIESVEKDKYPGYFDRGKMSCVFYNKQQLEKTLADFGNQINNQKIIIALSSVVFRKVENRFVLNGIIKGLLQDSSIFEGQIFQNRINGVGIVYKNSRSEIQNVDEKIYKTQNLIDLMNIPPLNIIEIYRGEFENGQSQGLGVKRIDHSKEYIGQFLSGEKEGFGSITKKQNWKIGFFKKGEFDKISVVGKQRLRTQINEYKNGQLHGYTIRLVNRRSETRVVELYQNGELKFLTNIEDE